MPDINALPEEERPENLRSSVYMAQRRNWSERTGEHVANARQWRLTALSSIVSNIALAATVAWVVTRPPHLFFVEVNKLGDAVAVGRVGAAVPADARIIRSQISRWVVAVRTVYADQEAQAALAHEAQAITDGHSDAERDLKAWYVSNPPPERAQREIVTVSVQSVLLLGGKMWRVEWLETTRNTQGGPSTSQSWQATIAVAVSPPTSDAQILANPGGVYVESYNWSQRS